MALVQNTSPTYMTTVQRTNFQDPNERSALSYINSLEPGAQNFRELFLHPQHNGAGFQRGQILPDIAKKTNPDLDNIYIDENLSDDENEISFSDITKTVGDVAEQVGDVAGQVGSAAEQFGKGVVDFGKNVLEQTGLIEKEKKEEQQKQKEKEKKKKKELKPPSFQEVLNKKRIKKIQEFFKNPPQEVLELTGGKKYTGPIDGKPGVQTRNVARRFEDGIVSALNNAPGIRRIYGHTILSDPEDVKKAARLAVEFKHRNDKKAMSRDDRMYHLSKIVIT